jgi:hypothetical protein
LDPRPIFAIQGQIEHTSILRAVVGNPEPDSENHSGYRRAVENRSHRYVSDTHSMFVGNLFEDT